MCNTVCTVCKKRRKKRKRGINLYCRMIFIASIVIHSIIFYCVFNYMLEPSSSHVAFVLKFFSLFFRDFAKKEKNLNIFTYFHFYFVFSLQTYFSTINSCVWGRLSYLVNVINIILYFYLE